MSGGTASSAMVPASSYAMTMNAPPGSTALRTASATSWGEADSTTRTPTAKPTARAASSMPCKAAWYPYSVVFGVSTVTDRASPPRSTRAARLGRNPSSSIACWTTARVEPRTLGWPLMTRDTVWYETPAAAATSRMLAGRTRRLRASSGR